MKTGALAVVYGEDVIGARFHLACVFFALLVLLFCPTGGGCLWTPLSPSGKNGGTVVFARIDSREHCSHYWPLSFSSVSGFFRLVGCHLHRAGSELLLGRGGEGGRGGGFVGSTNVCATVGNTVQKSSCLVRDVEKL